MWYTAWTVWTPGSLVLTPSFSISMPEQGRDE